MQWLASKNGPELRINEAPAFVHVPDEFDEPARAAYDDAREAEARQVEAVPCCPPSESMPCQACVTHEAAGDLSDDGWDDAHIWSTTDFAPDPDDAPDDEPPARSLADQVDVEVRHFRTLQTPFGDLIAETLARLADQARWLEAATDEQFRDRLDCMLDAEAARIEARQRGVCC